MRGFVRINIGVLDDDLFAARSLLFGFAREQRRAIGRAVEPDVDVPAAGHFDFRDALDRANLIGQFRRDLPRRLAQLPGELERRRHGHFAEFALPGLLHGQRQIHPVTGLNMRSEGAQDLLFNGMKHAKIQV